MTRYFMKFTPLFAAEVQMMTPPRHQPRRSGRIRSSFRYSADDVRCKDCTRYDSGHPCHLNECVCLEERIEAGVVELNALARECFGGRLFRPLQRRLRDELNRQPFRFFLSDAHRERWTHWKNRCYGMSGRNAAALFLLTADEELWQKVLWHFDSSGFDFPAIRLSGIHPELYSIYQAAKTISVGGDNIVIIRLFCLYVVKDMVLYDARFYFTVVVVLFIKICFLCCRNHDTVNTKNRLKSSCNYNRMICFPLLAKNTPIFLTEYIIAHTYWQYN